MNKYVLTYKYDLYMCAAQTSHIEKYGRKEFEAKNDTEAKKKVEGFKLWQEDGNTRNIRDVHLNRVSEEVLL